MTQKNKTILVGIVLVLSVLWLCYTLLPVLLPTKAVGAPETAGWKLAQQLNQQLLDTKVFLDVSFSVETENPLKLKLGGMVRTTDDRKRLEELVESMRKDHPGAEIEILELEVLKK